MRRTDGIVTTASGIDRERMEAVGIELLRIYLKSHAERKSRNFGCKPTLVSSGYDSNPHSTFSVFARNFGIFSGKRSFRLTYRGEI